MINLAFHNIRIAWRNLMKYKVQNIISVLCLAVGMVVFSLTFILSQRTWQYFKRGSGDSHRAKVELFTKQDSLVFIKPSVIQRVANSHLPSIKFIDIYDWNMSTTQNIIDLDGKTHQMNIYWKWISPEHLNYLGLRSAITGKRIPVLKPGDVIMSKWMLKCTFGLDVNPIGYTLETAPECNGRKYNTIIDVVDTGDWLLAEENLYVVTDQLKEFAEDASTYMKQFDVILAKGKADKDLQKDLQKVLPEYKVTAKSGYLRMDIKEDITIMVFVGCSILIIGLFGFLKTQIQLFRLRQREMGLRQCMGAQQEQLFSLMMWEVAIVFFFVTLIVLGLTGLLAEYAVPIIENVTDGVHVDMSHTYATELWICLITFLVTTGIAALSVRRVITMPLSEVVGKSRRVSTKGRSLLIVSQMVICQLLIFILVSVLYFGDIMGDVYDRKPANQDALRRCIVTNNSIWKPEFKDSIPYLKHVYGSTHVATASFRQDLKEGDTPFFPRGVREENDSTRYCVYTVVLTDEHIFSLLNLELFPSDTEEKNRSILAPIYAPSDRADELRRKLGLRKAPTEYRIFEKDRQAEKIGYVRSESVALGWNEHIENPPFFLCDQEYFLNKDTIDFRVWKDFLNAYEGYGVQHDILFIAKPGEYKKAEQELTNLYQKSGKYTMIEAPIENLYESVFSDLCMIELMIQIMFIMAIVALLCIVLTLFSSVSLDTRGRQKEVAVRKAHGAGMEQIMWLFGKQYVWQLIISSIISLIFCLAYAVLFRQADVVPEFTVPYLCAIFFIALITLLTIGYKIYRVSKLDPAKIIKKE